MKYASILGLSALLLSACGMQTLTVQSSAFPDATTIPTLYTCDGQGISPPISIGNVPKEARALAIVLQDPDAPVAGGFLHWVMWNIPAETTELKEGAIPTGAIAGLNGAGKPGYFGPCPPAGPAHHYIFDVYAYDLPPILGQDASKENVLAALQQHVIAKGRLTGLYGKTTATPPTK